MVWVLLAGWILPARSQTPHKTVDRAQLQRCLSRAVDAQALSDLVRHPSGNYPGTQDRIVNPTSYNAPYEPCSVGALWHNEIASGRWWGRYQRMLALITRLRPTLVVDALNLWGTWEMAEHLTRARHLVADVKAVLPQTVVMGTCLEWVNEGVVQGRTIPPYVWDAFGLPRENRSFDCFRMRDGLTEDQRNGGFRVQIKHLETQLYFYWLATTYLSMGCEAISFSDISSTGSPGQYPAQWTGVIHRIRAYADTCRAVRFALITGHSATGFYDTAGRLLFDFHIEPIRPTEEPRNTAYRPGPNGGACTIKVVPQCPTLYQHGLGGVNPNGWTCDRNPGLVFFDNFLTAEFEFDLWGQPHPARRRKPWHCWSPYHLDEISWFALQTKAYRDSFLRFARRRVHQLDTNLYLALPLKRGVAAGTNPNVEYTCDRGDHYQIRNWWPAEYAAINPDDTLFPEPPKVGNYFFAQPDRARLPLWGGYGQEAVIQELLDGGD